MQPLPTPQRGQRSGFTLIEILVVIAIVAILIGLLVPAVQLVRTAANKTQSANNLNQIGVGIHSFVDEQGALPYNGLRDWWGWYAQRDSGSWGFQILPYIGEQPVWQNTASINLASGNINGPLGVRIAIYCDPERNRPSLTMELDYPRAGPTTDYAMNCWVNALPGDDITGAPNRRKRLESIPDGTSTTCIVGFSAFSIQDYDTQVGGGLERVVVCGRLRRFRPRWILLPPRQQCQRRVSCERRRRVWQPLCLLVLFPVSRRVGSLVHVRHRLNVRHAAGRWPSYSAV